jgi:hypothetical protein
MSGSAAQSARSEFVLKVERVHEGQTMIVRTLSETYGGLFTHYVRVQGKGESVYCDPAFCCTGRVRDKRFWKGYAACQWWRPELKVWVPITLEITESLELDFRDRFARGQVWELYRGEKTKRKQSPTMGRLLRQDAPESVPPEFDYKPPLSSLYHVFELDLSVKNPLPKRVLVEPIADEGPELPKVSLEQMFRQEQTREYVRLKQEEQRKRA